MGVVEMFCGKCFVLVYGLRGRAILSDDGNQSIVLSQSD